MRNQIITQHYSEKLFRKCGALLEKVRWWDTVEAVAEECEGVTLRQQHQQTIKTLNQS